MKYDPDLHHRHSIRLPGYDYAQPGAYFLTLCTFDRSNLFGEIVDSNMALNGIGRVVHEEWLRTATIRQEISLDTFQIMPNHFHAVVFIDDERATGRSPLPRPGPAPRSIGSLVAGFKAASTTRVNQVRNTPRQPLWQRNYYEHIVRTDDELARIRDYIAQNPIEWADDIQNPRAQPSPPTEPWQV